MTDEQPNATAAQEEPPQLTAEEVTRALKAATHEFNMAQAEEFTGKSINPIAIIVQQRIEFEKLAALIEELIAHHALDDLKLSMRLANRLIARVAELRKPRIAGVIHHALAKKGRS